MNFIKTVVAALRAAIFGDKAGRFLGRARVADVSYPYSSFNYRMPAGFPGDVNRSHPASIEPAVQNATNPVAAPGDVCVMDPATNTVRKILATDTGVTSPYGFAVRAFPYQQSTAAVDFGVGSLPTNQPVDVLRSGYILGKLNTGTATKGGAVFVWVAATSGAHIQGGLEVAASSGNTATLDPTRFAFNGPADSNGVVEVAVNP